MGCRWAQGQEMRLQLLGLDGTSFSCRVEEDMLGRDVARLLTLRLPGKEGARPVFCFKGSKLKMDLTIREALRCDSSRL